MDVCSNKVLKVGMMKYLGFFNTTKRSDGSTQMGGMDFETLQVLSTALNFSYTIHILPDYQYGNLLPNKTWTGVVGKLMSGKLDMAVTPLTVSEGRSKVIDYSSPYLFDYASFFINDQRFRNHKGAYFINPFELETWLATMTSYFIILLILYFVSRSANGTADRFQFLSSVIGQGLVHVQKYNTHYQIGVMLVLASWFIFCEVIVIYFCCTITASLNTEYGDVFRKAIVTFKDRSLVEWVFSGELAYLTNAKFFALLMAQNYSHKRYSKVPEHFSFCYLAIGIRKNLTCRNDVDRIINVLREVGLLMKWENELLRPVTKLRAKGVQYRASYIDFDDCRYCGYLWSLGTVIAFAAVLFEVFLSGNRIQLERKNKKRMRRLPERNGFVRSKTFPPTKRVT